MSLIKEVYDGKNGSVDPELDKLANTVASQTSGKSSAGGSKPASPTS